MRHRYAFVLASALIAGPLAAQHARPPQTLAVGAPAGGTAVVSADDRTAVLWEDETSHQLLVRVADGRGTVFGAAVRIDDGTGADKHVDRYSIAAADGFLYAAWRDERNGRADVYFCGSADGGLTWSPNRRIEDGSTPGSRTVDELQLCASGDYVYVGMLVDDVLGVEGAWMAGSYDHGQNWNPTMRADTGNANCDFLSICCEDINAWIVFADDRNGGGLRDFYLRMTHSGASTWMRPEQHLDASGAGSGDVEGVLVRGGMLGLVTAWLEDQLPASPIDRELHYLYSPNGGHLWPNAEVVVATGADAEQAAMAYDGVAVLLAWATTAAAATRSTPR